jgi:hypothetical protein
MILVVLFQVYKRKQRRGSDLARELADPRFMAQLEKFNQGGGLRSGLSSLMGMASSHASSSSSATTSTRRSARLGGRGLDGPAASGLLSSDRGSGYKGSGQNATTRGDNTRASRLRDALARSVARRRIAEPRLSHDNNQMSNRRSTTGKPQYSWLNEEIDEDEEYKYSDFDASDEDEERLRARASRRQRSHQQQSNENNDIGDDQQLQQQRQGDIERSGLAASDDYDEADDGYDIPRVRRRQHTPQSTTTSAEAIPPSTSDASVQPPAMPPQNDNVPISSSASVEAVAPTSE